MKRIAAWGALGVLVLVSSSSQASFTVCNYHPSGAWVAFTTWVPPTSEVTVATSPNECSIETLSCCGGSGQFNAALRTNGWWRIETNQCATVYGDPLWVPHQTSSPSAFPTTANIRYVHYNADDGATLSADETFAVEANAFQMDQGWIDVNLSCSSACTMNTYPIPCAWYNETFAQVNTGNYTSYTLNVY